MSASPVEDLATRRQEFEAHVWNHADDVFQTDFDVRVTLTDAEVAGLTKIVELIRAGKTEDELAAHLHSALSAKPDFIYVVLQIVGLTRSKIISDLKAALAGTGVKVPSSAHLLPKRPAAWKLAAPYLAKRLRTSFTPLLSAHDEALEGALEAMNQVTWPGWIRQERAKRQGHAAEGRLAVLLKSLGIPFQPEEKADNPLCSDATYLGVSFDLVVPDVLTPRLCVKATVHTANIGQYGESKDHLEVTEARDALAADGGSAKLLAFIDGVGFFSNTAGLEGVLTKADEFCQFQTLWKAAVLAAHACGACVAVALQDPDAHAFFLRRYSASVDVRPAPDDSPDWIEAGEALARML